MMRGTITPDREASLRITVHGPAGAEHETQAIIDTGFNGYLTLPPSLVSFLALTYHGQAFARLADGSTILMRKFEASVTWHGRQRDVIVLEADGDPLIGMSLLYGNRVTLGVLDGGPVTIEPMP
jgi:clan AA aspartic protease